MLGMVSEVEKSVHRGLLRKCVGFASRKSIEGENESLIIKNELFEFPISLKQFVWKVL
jgi:hypothetical protein